jgi:hypothetical protein
MMQVVKRLSDFTHKIGENFAQPWGRFCGLTKSAPDHGYFEHVIYHCFYNGFNEESKRKIHGRKCMRSFYDFNTRSRKHLIEVVSTNEEQYYPLEEKEQSRGMLPLSPKVMDEARADMKIMVSMLLRPKRLLFTLLSNMIREIRLRLAMQQFKCQQNH